MKSQAEGEGCAGHLPPPASPFAPVAPGPHPRERSAGSRAHCGRSHFYAAACDRLSRFRRLRQFAPTFRLKLPSAASLLFSSAGSVGSSPCLFFPSSSSSFAATTTLIDAHPPKGRAGRASCGQPTPGRLERRARELREAAGWSGGASERRRVPHGRPRSESETERRILPGYHLPGEEEAENAPEQFIGTQGTEEGEPLWHLTAASALLIPLREFGITLTMWDFFFFRPLCLSLSSSAHG